MTILFVITNLIHFNFAQFLQTFPMLDLMAIFYFAVFRKIFAVWFLFFIGLWHDAIMGNVLGLTSFLNIFLVKLFIIINSRLMIRDSFSHVWYQFSIFSALFLLIKWFILSSLYNDFYNILWLLFSWILSSLLYFVIHKFFDYISAKLLRIHH